MEHWNRHGDGVGGRMQQPWSSWLNDTLNEIRDRRLLRTLRMKIPTLSSMEVRMSRKDFNEWVSDEQQRSLSRTNPGQVGSGGDCHRLPARTVNAHAGNDLEDVTVKLFSSNDYLGLSTHEKVRMSMKNASEKYGSGTRSSAAVAGYTVSHRELENGLAKLKKTEEALLAPTGYAANLAVFSALASNADVDIFSDELNHASIVDGARLAKQSGAGLYIYRHNDMKDLETMLENSSKRRKLIVTDSLFSMDGDYADLKGLSKLKQRFPECLLAVDEAHATLVCGPTGAGVAEEQGVEDSIDIHIGTMSKAFGSIGGYVACHRSWKELLVNRGRAQLFSTALPVPVVEASSAALAVSIEEPWRRTHLMNLWHILGGESQIVPVIVGDESRAVAASTSLLLQGLHVPAIRPPTVPKGTSRLRISLSAAHTREDIEFLRSQLSLLKLDDKRNGYWKSKDYVRPRGSNITSCL